MSTPGGTGPVAEEEFTIVFENALEAIVLVSADGTIVDLNPSALKLYSREREELIGRSVFDELMPETAEKEWAAYFAQLQSNELVTGTTTVIAGDETIPIEFRVRANYRPGVHLCLLRSPVMLNGRNGDGGPSLTPREREIFRLLALGYNAPEIAQQLVLSPATVRTHVQNGVARLGAKTRVQAIALALTRGDISL